MAQQPHPARTEGRAGAGVSMRPKELVTALFAALSEGRVADAAALFRPDGAWWMLASRAEVPSTAWFAGYARAAGTLFPTGITFTVTSMIGEGDRVAAQVQAHAELPDGTWYRNSYHFLCEIDGARLRRVWEYGDTLHAQRVLRGGG